MGRKVDKEVRTDEVLLTKEDGVAYNINYFGRTEIILALDSEPVWQIKRVTTSAGIKKVEYANYGKYNLVWADRYSYFSPDPPAESAPPLGSVSITGLTIAGKITVVTLNDATWTALPAVPLANRNQINLQNESSFDFKLRYDNVFAGYAGVTIASGSERQYGIRDTIVVYAKWAPGGSGTITVEELS
jgi:hypothetical protein